MIALSRSGPRSVQAFDLKKVLCLLKAVPFRDCHALGWGWSVQADNLSASVRQGRTSSRECPNKMSTRASGSLRCVQRNIIGTINHLWMRPGAGDQSAASRAIQNPPVLANAVGVREGCSPDDPLLCQAQNPVGPRSPGGVLLWARNSPRSQGRDDSSIAHSITTRAA